MAVGQKKGGRRNIMKMKLFYLVFAVAILVLIINIVAFPALPDKVPVHWGLNGEPNRYGSKLENLFLSALPLVLLILFKIIPAIDPKRESFQKHSKAYSILILFIILFISAMNLMGLFSALGYKINFSVVLPIFLGILFIVIGNYLSQIRPNYFVGIRTPWTLASEYVWRKTHRFGGYVFVIIGLFSFFSFLLNGLGMYLFLAALIIGMVTIILYSYLIFKKRLC